MIYTIYENYILKEQITTKENEIILPNKENTHITVHAEVNKDENKYLKIKTENGLIMVMGGILSDCYDFIIDSVMSDDEKYYKILTIFNEKGNKDFWYLSHENCKISIDNKIQIFGLSGNQLNVIKQLSQFYIKSNPFQILMMNY